MKKRLSPQFFNYNGMDYVRHIFFKNQPLEYAKNYKYLGVDICEDLSMDIFVKNVHKKANFTVYMFSRIRKYITKYAAIMIHKQTIVPFLDYAGFLMDSAHQYSLALLDKIHKRCIRIIEYKKKSEHDQNIQNLMRNYCIQNLK